MSLINQMLQDLDARRAAHGVGSRLPNDVRPLPAARSSRIPLLVLGGVLVLAIGGGFALYRLQAGPQHVPAPPLAAAPAQPSVPTPVVPPAVSPASVPEPQAPVQVALQPAIEAPPPVLDRVLRQVEPSVPAEEKKVAPPPGKASAAVDKAAGGDVNTVRAAADRPLPASAAPAPAARPTRAISIERSEAAGSPHERAEADYRKAIAAVNQGRVADAVDVLRSALRQDSLHVASRQLLVNLLLEAKRSDEAIELLRDGLQGQPAQIGWAMSLARLRLEHGDLAGAWQTLDDSLPAAAGSADYQGFAGHVLQRLGRNREAAEHYQAATRLAPGDGRWWLGLGLAMEAEGRAGEAREAFLRARQSGNLSAALTTLVDQKLR